MFSGTPNPPTLRVAICRSSSIGDVVLATACLNMLKRLKVSTQVFWLGRQPSLGLITSAYPEIIPIEINHLEATIESTSQPRMAHDVHLIIDLQKNLRSHWACSQLAKASGAPIFSWNKETVRRSSMIIRSRLFGRSQVLDPEKIRPRHLQYQMMLQTLRKALEKHLPVELRDGIREDAPPCLPSIHDQGDRPWQKELRFGRWVAVAPGAAHATKKAPIELIAEILSYVKKSFNAESDGVGLLFLGDEHDRETSLRLIDLANWPHATLNLAGKLSLWESALALKEAKVLLSNDSSLAHIAEAVETPVGVLFGPTIEAFGFAPRMRTSSAFSSPLGCRPCSKHGKAPCRYGDHKCFYDLDANLIANFILERVG